MLSETEFNAEVDEIFVTIEDQLDELELDLDIDTSGGLLTITFDSGGTLIFSRQPASREIWIAARSGGYHLGKVEAAWQTGDGQSLTDLVNQLFSEQLGEAVEIL